MLTQFERKTTTADVENALVHQKDRLLQLLNNENADDVKTVVNFLIDNRELWAAIGYSYKGEEISKRAARVLRDIIDNLPYQARVKRQKLLELHTLVVRTESNFYYDNRKYRYGIDRED